MRKLTILCILLLAFAISLGSCDLSDSEAGSSESSQSPTEGVVTPSGDPTSAADTGTENEPVSTGENTTENEPTSVEEVTTKDESHLINESTSEYGLSSSDETTDIETSTESEQTSPSHEHTPSEWIVDKEATCKEAGSRYKECTSCETVLLTEEIEKLTTHVYTNDLDRDCNVCGEERTIICEHTNTTVVSGKEASCTEAGLSDGVICSDCSEVITPQTPIPPSHKERIIPRVEPKCDSEGSTEGKDCLICHTVIQKPERIGPLGCTGGEWIIETEPTEFEAGERRKVCIRCGKVVCTEVIPPYLEEDGSKGLEYIFSEDKIIIISIGDYNSDKLIIPTSISGLPVVGIEDGAFKDCTDLTSIKIPNSVTYIGNSAFENCSAVTVVTLPDSLKRIGNDAFKGCKLISEITIPASVTELGSGIFDGAKKLGTLYYNASVAPVGEIFASTNISNVIFGGTVIPAGILENATKVYSVSMTDSVTSIGNRAFCGCSGLESVQIGKNVKTIGESAFYGCDKLEGIEIPNGVTSIGGSAFGQCTRLGTVVLPRNLSKIEAYAFQRCSALKSIEIPAGVTTIGEGAFEWCTALKSITLPDSIEVIERNAFIQCTLLETVYFSGSEEEWLGVTIGTNNAPLIDAQKVYGG